MHQLQNGVRLERLMDNIKGNIGGFIEQLSSILPSIPPRIRKEKMNEAYFHIMIHTCLVTIGFDVLSEVSLMSAL